MGGWKPGFLTTALSVCGAAFFLVRPYYSFRVSSTSDLLRIAGSAVVGIAISILCEALHRAWARIEERQQRLEQALQQLRIVTDSMSASIAHCSRDLKISLGEQALRRLDRASSRRDCRSSDHRHRRVRRV